MAARRPYGSGSLLNVNRTYYGKWRAPSGQQIKRRIAPLRTPHRLHGLTKTQAETRLPDLMRDTTATAPTAQARTLEAAMEAWLTHLAATSCKATSVAHTAPR
jgi:hypothetical protein